VWQYCRTNLCSEAVEFLIEAGRFKKEVDSKNQGPAVERAKSIHERFLRRSSDEEINVAQKLKVCLRKPCRAGLFSGARTLSVHGT
jgi:hypothetical protein